ncbi:hypothetical protein IU450_28025 [Nocardia abscessus]|uniref:hypothetical protein n=1 Tax=Nocardia abscessus TaxID=120957 RepID=UPI001893D938|nr:hypothetical protein [Nocardia abscessus]MBF6339710.1 hypothetical protein [Nocardia abscessus]
MVGKGFVLLVLDRVTFGATALPVFRLGRLEVAIIVKADVTRTIEHRVYIGAKATEV